MVVRGEVAGRKAGGWGHPLYFFSFVCARSMLSNKARKFP